VTLWSRGIMRACCDVYPMQGMVSLSKPQGLRARGEHSMVDWETVAIHDGAIVYVPSLDVPAFLRRFTVLPKSYRITLVSGGEDVGMPRELFGLGHITGRRRTMLVKMPLELGEFLGDARLLHWWVQNFDLSGCTVWTGCEPASSWAWLSHKVSPLPIGVDLHKLSERGIPVGASGRKQSACSQQAEVESIRESLPSFHARPNALLAPFSCARSDRRAACDALKRQKVHFFGGNRSAMWREMGKHAFVAAPPGHGQDTHRAWEVLALGSVPVVLSSSIDRLYSEFPVITVNSWEDVRPGLMGSWRREIERRFGADPFDARMRSMLTTEHWARRIATRHMQDSISLFANFEGGWLPGGWGQPRRQQLLPTLLATNDSNGQTFIA